MKVDAVIVEDEPLARRSLREFIARVPWLDVVDEAADGLTAVRVIERARPRLVFLDVQLPERSGLEVLAALTHRPALVFTTAHDDYAVTAFELGAVDYLVKPFGLRRFLTTIERVRVKLEGGGPPTGADPVARIRGVTSPGPLRRLFARTGDRIIPVAIDEITRLESAGDYVEVHAGDSRHLLNATLNELQARLDPERFVRVHRSHIVNLDRVTHMRARDDRRLCISLDDGSTLLASRAGSRRLRELIS